MAVQIINMGGSIWADRITALFGEERIIYTVPLLIFASLILLAVFQVLPALAFIGVIGFITSVVRPSLLNRIQNEVSDDVRATIISAQSLMFTVAGAISQPSLGLIADRSGFPAAYYGFAGVLGILIIFLFWKSRHYFPNPAVAA